MMKKLKSLFVISLLSGLVAVYFSDTLFSEQVFSFRDLSRYYYPLRQFAFAQLKEGSFPFWNPYAGSGHPLFAALQSVVLYPLSVVYLIPDFDFAFNFFIILHVFLGGWFFYLLMRSLKYSRISGVISACVFMFSGYIISVVNLTTTLTAAVWFPLVFLFFNKALETGRGRFILLTSLFLGMMFLGGEPTPFYSALFMLALFGIYQVCLRNCKVKALAKAYFGAVFLFICLFSFQIIPFVELIRLSNRAGPVFDNAVHWSFPPRDLVNLVLPFFYGPLHFQKDTPLRQDWLLLSYLGIMPLILFVAASIFDRDRWANFFKAVFVLGLLFIFGKFTPLYRLFFNYVPGFSLIRYPVKFFFIPAVAFAFLAGAGWGVYELRVRKGCQRFRVFLKGLLMCGFVAALVFLALYIYKEDILRLAQGIISRQGAEGEGLFKSLLVFSVDFYNLRRLLFFLIFSTCVLFIGSKKRTRVGLVGAVVIGVIFVDLYGGKNIEINPGISRTILHQETSNISFLKKDSSFFRVYASSAMNKHNEALRGATYEEAFAKSIDNLSSNRLMEYGIFDARGYFSIHNSNYSKVLNLADTAPLPSSTNVLNMLNVKYILTLKEVDDPRSKLVNRGIESFLYENLDCLPRAYLVSGYRVIKDEAAMAKMLSSKDFKPQELVILEEEPQICAAPQASRRRGGLNLPYDSEGGESVQILSYHSNEVAIDAHVAGRGKFLVLADNYYPGWEVFVDGQKAKLHKANFVLRAVYLLPGSHRVAFRFNPVSFKWGCFISLATLAALAIAYFYGIMKPRDKKP